MSKCSAKFLSLSLGEQFESELLTFQARSNQHSCSDTQSKHRHVCRPHGAFKILLSPLSLFCCMWTSVVGSMKSFSPGQSFDQVPGEDRSSPLQVQLETQQKVTSTSRRACFSSGVGLLRRELDLQIFTSLGSLWKVVMRRFSAEQEKLTQLCAWPGK